MLIQKCSQITPIRASYVSTSGKSGVQVARHRVCEKRRRTRRRKEEQTRTRAEDLERPRSSTSQSGMKEPRKPRSRTSQSGREECRDQDVGGSNRGQKDQTPGSECDNPPHFWRSVASPGAS
ncbi:hypothetical protein NDU88_006333 [Pleurodeles waltl]|uniref:Uncharacterized protein n=1 Tax=Pleurodeles waltl TaxID=8319 RepID=A0AAV7TXD5_PLEWA|nr:hypothetical protein NDU88_006333 [Pleurodeles waltl]